HADLLRVGVEGIPDQLGDANGWVAPCETAQAVVVHAYGQMPGMCGHSCPRRPCHGSVTGQVTRRTDDASTAVVATSGASTGTFEPGALRTVLCRPVEGERVSVT